MALTWRRQESLVPPTPAQRRAARIATPDLYGWAEQALNGIGMALNDWRRDPLGPALDEAATGAEALLAVVQELRRRHGR